jgi:16S rRNA (cytidine1402-2'-O)-methyltransferase
VLSTIFRKRLFSGCSKKGAALSNGATEGSKMKFDPGTLYIVATPIGNLEDITHRALRILSEVDGVLAEDTRHTWPLLHHFGIQKKMISYFEHTSERKTEDLVRQLKEGSTFALVSDAGTPCLSDPGARLVGEARRQGVTVVPIPGPSAAMAALMVAGLPTEPFHFWGFLSPSRGKRRKVYDHVLNLKGTHCFYESPHKILKHIEEWKEEFPDFYCLVAKELTKKFETTWSGTVADVAKQLKTTEIRGEFTVLFSKESF